MDEGAARDKVACFVRGFVASHDGKQPGKEDIAAACKADASLREAYLALKNAALARANGAVKPAPSNQATQPPTAKTVVDHSVTAGSAERRESSGKHLVHATEAAKSLPDAANDSNGLERSDTAASAKMPASVGSVKASPRALDIAKTAPVIPLPELEKPAKLDAAKPKSSQPSKSGLLQLPLKRKASASAAASSSSSLSASAIGKTFSGPVPVAALIQSSSFGALFEPASQNAEHSSAATVHSGCSQQARSPLSSSYSLGATQLLGVHVLSSVGAASSCLAPSPASFSSSSSLSSSMIQPPQPLPLPPPSQQPAASSRKRASGDGEYHNAVTIDLRHKYRAKKRPKSGMPFRHSSAADAAGGGTDSGGIVTSGLLAASSDGAPKASGGDTADITESSVAAGQWYAGVEDIDATNDAPNIEKEGSIDDSGAEKPDNRAQQPQVVAQSSKQRPVSSPTSASADLVPDPLAHRLLPATHGLEYAAPRAAVERARGKGSSGYLAGKGDSHSFGRYGAAAASSDGPAAVALTSIDRMGADPDVIDVCLDALGLSAPTTTTTLATASAVAATSSAPFASAATGLSSDAAAPSPVLKIGSVVLPLPPPKPALPPSPSTDSPAPASVTQPPQPLSSLGVRSSSARANASAVIEQSSGVTYGPRGRPLCTGEY